MNNGYRAASRPIGRSYSRRLRDLKSALAVGGCILGASVFSGTLLGGSLAAAAFPGQSGKITYTSSRDGGNPEIYVSNADGSNPTRLTNNSSFDAESTFSADGKRIAFTSGRDGGPPEIYVMNAAGSNAQRLTNNNDDDFEPAFSPDGQRIAFTSQRDGNAEIYVMDADGSNQVNLTNNAADDNGAVFSPDGQKIAFRSTRDGTADIYVMNSDGSNVVRLTADGANDGDPDFSPDGAKIVFSSTGGPSGNGIYVMNADGSAPTALNTSAPAGYQPAFSPDGQQVAFTRPVDGSNHDVFVMDADGSQEFNLTNAPGVDNGPNWGVVPAPPPATSLASISSSGAQGNAQTPALSFDISESGRYVVFDSDASNLAPGDLSAAATDIFVRDRSTGETERVTAGSDSDSDSIYPAISADGRYLAFASLAALVPGDTFGWNFYVYDRDTDTIEKVGDGGGGTRPAISADGRFVAFRDAADRLAVYDRQSQSTEIASVSSIGVEANSQSCCPSLSADGRYVSFASLADNLVPGDTNGTFDIFVHDMQTGDTTRASVASDGTEANGRSLQGVDGAGTSLSSDGRYVAFYSRADNLAPGATNGFDNVFVHDQQTGDTTRISTGSGVIDPNGSSQRPSISSDGRFVVFDSNDTELLDDGLDAQGVFVQDRVTGVTTRVSVALDGGASDSSSFPAAISGDGTTVAFASSATNLVASDSNGVKDLFVRRIAPAATAITEQAAAGGTVTTNQAVTVDDPVGTSVTTPVAGPVSIIEEPTTTPDPVGYSLLGQQVEISAPDATAADPLVLEFRLDASLVPDGADASSLQLFRDGVSIADCDPGAGTSATPDPCVADRANVDGGVAITIRSSHASAWNFGLAVHPCDAPTITGNSANNTINGTAADDIIDGGGGNDTIRGANGDDVICGADGKDTLYGGPGADTVIGEAGNDVLNGDADPDTLIGDYYEPTGDATALAGDDQLKGFGGADLLIGDSQAPAGGASSAGTDKLTPGADGGLSIGDNSTESGSEAAGPDTLTGDSGPDWLVGDNYSTSSSAEDSAAGLDTINANGGADGVVGDNQTLGSASASKVDKINSGAGVDGLVVGDNLSAGNAYGGAADSINSGTAAVGGVERLVGDNYVSGSGSAFGGGNDILTANTGDDVLVGDNFASGSGSASGGGDDKLASGSGTNQLYGDNVGTTTSGGGRDALTGGSGADALDGGPDRDTCAGAGGLFDTATRCETITGVP